MKADLRASAELVGSGDAEGSGDDPQRQSVVEEHAALLAAGLVLEAVTADQLLRER